MPGTYCSVVKCSNNTTKDKVRGIRFFTFPTKDIEQRKKWIDALKRRDPNGSSWTPSKHSLVCSDHFNGGKPNRSRFHPDYAPSCFLANSMNEVGRNKRFLKKPTPTSVENTQSDPIEIEDSSSAGSEIPHYSTASLTLRSLRKRKCLESGGQSGSNMNKLLELSDIFDMLREGLCGLPNWATFHRKSDHKHIFAYMLLDPLPSCVTKLEVDSRTGQLWIENRGEILDIQGLIPYDIDCALGGSFCALRPFPLCVDNLINALIQLSSLEKEDPLEIGLKVLNKNIIQRSNNSEAYEIVKRL